MDRYDVMRLIEEDVHADIYGDLYGHGRVAELVVSYIEGLQAKIKELETKLDKKSWEGYVDRQGGSFTDQEMLDRNTWR